MGAKASHSNTHKQSEDDGESQYTAPLETQRHRLWPGDEVLLRTQMTSKFWELYRQGVGVGGSKSGASKSSPEVNHREGKENLLQPQKQLHTEGAFMFVSPTAQPAPAISPPPGVEAKSVEGLQGFGGQLSSKDFPPNMTGWVTFVDDGDDDLEGPAHGGGGPHGALGRAHPRFVNVQLDNGEYLLRYPVQSLLPLHSNRLWPDSEGLGSTSWSGSDRAIGSKTNMGRGGVGKAATNTSNSPGGKAGGAQKGVPKKVDAFAVGSTVTVENRCGRYTGLVTWVYPASASTVTTGGGGGGGQSVGKGNPSGFLYSIQTHFGDYFAQVPHSTIEAA
jgi:hypothetical protein